jgi:hypothetical protein
MNDYLIEGSVVICDSGQAGTLTHLDRAEACVLLRNGELWHGIVNRLRKPQDDADLAACPIDVERVVKTKKIIRD